MSKFKYFELFLVGCGIVSFSLISTTTIQADMMAYIPTIINGLVSAISLIIGISGVIITFAVSNRLISFEENQFRLFLTLTLLTVPILLLWPMYNHLVSGNVVLAFKEAMIAFLFGQVLILDLIAFMARSSMSERVKNPQAPASNV